jgi:hypothetical protein
MSAKVINIFAHMKGERQEVHNAVMRTFERPFDEDKNRDSLTKEYMASWFVLGLWMEGYKIVRCDDGGPDESSNGD